MTDLLWAGSWVTLAVGGCMFRWLPRNRNAAGWGMAAGAALALVFGMVLVWHVNLGNFR